MYNIISYVYIVNHLDAKFVVKIGIGITWTFMYNIIPKVYIV